MAGSPFQGLLASVVRDLFPKQKILTNARKSSALINPSTGKYLELDVVVPSQNLCFEFQDIYHYATTWYSQSPLNLIQENDNCKSDFVRKANYTLVVVPCWWDGSKESLISTILFQRPDLPLPQVIAEPIHFNSTTDQFISYTVPDVGEVMLASFAPSLSSLFSDSVKLHTPWWMGEKYDGVRCIWNPNQNILYTRRGFSMEVLDCHVEIFRKCNTFLDGEIWYGRGNYLDSFRLLRSDLNDIEFAFMRVPVFDDPSPSLQSLPFEKRYRNLLEHIDNSVPFITIAVRKLVFNKKQISDSLQTIIYNSGEGLMLRKPKTLYESGRSSSLIKLKVVRGDTEALVVGVEHPWYLLKLPSGIKFSVEAPESRLKIGDIVTLSYESYSKKEVPVAPIITRTRSDLDWDEVMSDYAKENSEKDISNKLSHLEPTFKVNTSQKLSPENKERDSREIMEDFARSHHLDPRISDTWYRLPYSLYFEEKAVRSVLRNFKGDLVTTLRNVFPELKFDISRFQFIPGVFWNTVQNRRDLFDNFANNFEFDSMQASSWYSVKRTAFASIKAIMSLVNTRYGGQVGNALSHLYPDIGLDKRKFNLIYYWNGVKDFFLNFAKLQNFDPLIPENWYSVTYADIWLQKDARLHLAYYKGNFAKTLMHVFPNIGLTEIRFSNRHGEFWSNPENRRNFFTRFAETSKFDPLIAQNWYFVKRSHITSVKGAMPVLHFHNDDHVTALIQLFPEVSFNKSLFVDGNFWQDPNMRRQFFEDISSENEFDPLIPENWYPFSRERIHQIRDGKSVLNYHRNSVSLALTQLFPEIPFDTSKFYDNFWNNESNRVGFFVSFAELHKFDPLVAENWYNFTQDDILNHKNGGTILEHHQNNFVFALQQLFPNVRFDRAQFKKNHWSDPSNRRKYMNRIAYQNGFNVLQPESWYSFDPSTILNDKNGKIVLAYHRGSLLLALRQLFPSVRFESTRFLYSNSSEAHRRVAKPKTIQIKMPKQYQEPPINVTGAKNQFEQSLEENINQQSHPNPVESAFESHSIKSKNYWTNENNRRNFFIEFARDNNFNPYESMNWYMYSYWDIRNQKKSTSVLAYYRGNHKTALMHLFPNIGLDITKFVN